MVWKTNEAQAASNKKIAIIGGGWYGCHLALSLAKQGYEVTIFEKNSDIFSELSGNFGVRLHVGPHYPRSEETRKSCLHGQKEFEKTYPDLVVPHESSIYGLGTLDYDKKPPKVGVEEFKKVCKEAPECKPVHLDPKKYHNIQKDSTHSVHEPSIQVGAGLRENMKKRLEEAGVKIVYNYQAKEIKRQGDKTIVNNGETSQSFDNVINATSYQSLLPKDLPFDMNIRYQVCTVLLYEDTQKAEKPFSFTLMDGWYPCLMPYVDDTSNENGQKNYKYILYHAKHTIRGSFDTPEQARKHMADTITDQYVERELKGPMEQHMASFWSEFTTDKYVTNETTNQPELQKGRFKYVGHKTNVLAKIVTDREFRSAVTFEKDGVIYVFPGKINSVFNSQEEVESILKNENLLNKKGYRYVKGGVLDSAMPEITEKPIDTSRNTCFLQTYKEAQKSTSANAPLFFSNSAPESTFEGIARKYCTQLDDYIGKRAGTFWLRDLLSLQLACVLGCLGYKTEQAKRSEFIKELQKAVNKPEMSTADIQYKIQEGIKRFSPRAQMGQKGYDETLHCILTNFNAEVGKFKPPTNSASASHQ
ncbi:FAD-dependent oxidoreductase [Legionella dresdenensis]|uniref:FAD-dependent oxidoreductase n=1 Tax=Legionella dresdenensis TaxID=450200 RepID=A0ABV8CGF6_9GAMM